MALATLTFAVLDHLKRQGFFVEAFEEGEWIGTQLEGEVGSAPPRIADPNSWLIHELGRDNLWLYLQEPAHTTILRGPFDDRDLLFDVVELYIRDVISMPVTDADGAFEGFYDRAAGRRYAREKFNKVLSRCDPPYEMLRGCPVCRGTSRRRSRCDYAVASVAAS